MSPSRVLNCLSALALFLGVLPAANSAQEAESHLEYVLQPRTSEATLGKTYLVDVYLKNNSSREITLCKCNLNGEIHYAKLRGGESVAAVDRYRTTDIPKQSDFVTVMPGSTTKLYGAGFGREYFRSTGQWSLKIRETYKSVPYAGASQSWAGSIESNSITVTVREP